MMITRELNIRAEEVRSAALDLAKTLREFPGGLREGELERYLFLRRRHGGARAILVLLKHRGRRLSAGLLGRAMSRRSLPETLPADRAALARNHVRLVEEPIPYCDRRTLREVSRRLNRLRALQGEGMDDPAQQEGIRSETSQLERYLKECLTPQGTIRCFPSTPRRDYKRLRQSIKRFLLCCRREMPHLEGVILAHLKTGKTFVWRK
jgi:hypothetical protein